MPTVVIPFAGAPGKTRLHDSATVRRVVSRAMLADVLAVATTLGRTLVVTSDEEGAAAAREAGAETLADPGGGQGPAVAAGVAAAGADGILVVNSDVPCVGPDDLRALLAATPARGLALVEATDGTTNALGLATPDAFAPLYGAGSAARFRAHAAALGGNAAALTLPGLVDDVDTFADLERLLPRCGAHTRACLAGLAAGAPA